MSLSRRHFLISGAALAALPMRVRAGPPDRIRVAYHDTPDDLWRTAPSGATIGIAPEILQEIVTRGAGFALDYIGLPWLRAQEAVQDRDADALFTIPNDARRRFMRFTPTPLVSYQLAIVYSVDGLHAAVFDQVDTVETLQRFTYVYNQFDMSQTERARDFGASVPSPGDMSMLREVAGSRGDFTVANPTRIRSVLEAMGLSQQLKVRVLPALGRVDHHFGLRSSYPEVDAAIGRIEVASLAAQSAGRIQAILDRHA